MSEMTLERIGNGLRKVIDAGTNIIGAVSDILERLSLKPVDNVIYECATNQTMIKVKGNALDIERVQCSFVEFDAHSHKLKSNIEIYLDISEALCLCHDILSGKIAKMAVREKERCQKENIKYPSSVYDSPLGGVSEEKAASRKLRSDGKAISRCFTISPGSKADFLFTAMQRAGHTDPKLKKLIVPEGNPEVVIRIPCTERQLKSFGLVVEAHIRAYLAAKYTHNGYARQQQ